MDKEYLQIKKIINNLYYFKQKIKEDKPYINITDIFTIKDYNKEKLIIDFFDKQLKKSQKRIIFILDNENKIINKYYSYINSSKNREYEFSKFDNPEEIDNFYEYIINFKDSIEYKYNLNLTNYQLIGSIALFTYKNKEDILYKAIFNNNEISVIYKGYEESNYFLNGRDSIDFLVTKRFPNIIDIIEKQLNHDIKNKEDKNNVNIIIKGSESLEPYLDYLRNQIKETIDKGLMDYNDVILKAYIPELNNIIPNYDLLDDNYKKKVIKSIEDIEKMVRQKSEDDIKQRETNAKVNIDTLNKILNN